MSKISKIGNKMAENKPFVRGGGRGVGGWRGSVSCGRLKAVPSLSPANASASLRSLAHSRIILPDYPLSAVFLLNLEVSQEKPENLLASLAARRISVRICRSRGFISTRFPACWPSALVGACGAVHPYQYHTRTSTSTSIKDSTGPEPVLKTRTSISTSTSIKDQY